MVTTQPSCTAHVSFAKGVGGAQGSEVDLKGANEDVCGTPEQLPLFIW